MHLSATTELVFLLIWIFYCYDYSIAPFPLWWASTLFTCETFLFQLPKEMKFIFTNLFNLVLFLFNRGDCGGGSFTSAPFCSKNFKSNSFSPVKEEEKKRLQTPERLIPIRYQIACRRIRGMKTMPAKMETRKGIPCVKERVWGR